MQYLRPSGTDGCRADSARVMSMRSEADFEAAGDFVGPRVRTNQPVEARDA